MAVADDDPEVVITGNALFKVSDIYTGTLDGTGNVIQGLGWRPDTGAERVGHHY